MCLSLLGSPPSLENVFLAWREEELAECKTGNRRNKSRVIGFFFLLSQYLHPPPSVPLYAAAQREEKSGMHRVGPKSPQQQQQPPVSSGPLFHAARIFSTLAIFPKNFLRNAQRKTHLGGRGKKL